MYALALWKTNELNQINESSFNPQDLIYFVLNRNEEI
jgi:hypothetical protein